MGVQDMKTEAGKIEKYLSSNPGATVQEIAAKLKFEENNVILILDEWEASDKGAPKYVGEGKGGNWFPARQAQVG